MYKLFFYVLSIIFITLTISLVWYLIIFLFLFIKSKADFFSNKVTKVQTNHQAEAFQVYWNQLIWLQKTLKSLILLWKNQQENNERAKRKFNVLANTTNHINEKIEEDIGLKTVSPATTGGIDVWVYLSNKPSTQEEINLENYFMGVLSIYTSEFALDRMSIEINAGAGWVAKFDLKTTSEAHYNRMSRASDVHVEDLYDEDDSVW